MERFVHVLRERARSVTWIVRADGVSDIVLKGEEAAHAFGRVIAQRLADRVQKDIVLRKWGARAHFEDEVFRPQGLPADESRVARKRDAA